MRPAKDYLSALRVAMVCLIGLLAAVVLSGPVLAQDAAVGGPWLRIETGAHTATSHDAAVDADGTVLVTASEDKTARIWSLPDLRPLGVLRPPVGPKEQGRIYAVAVSPDARLTAVGGWISAGNSGTQDILVFSLQTRQVVLRLRSDAPNIITALAFSPDGKRLAAGIGGASGVRVWRVPDGALLNEDRDYGNSTYGLAFAPDGRLAAASHDGAIRLYDPDGRQLRRVRTETGQQPFKIRFDQGGRSLAVVYADVLAAEVRDGTSLTLRTRADVAELQGQAFSTVGWSADGATLYAGGYPLVQDKRSVFAWADAGRRARRVAMTGFDAIPAAILPLRNGRLAMMSHSGDIAVVGQGDKRIAERRTGAGTLSDLSGDDTGPRWRLALSQDGSVVEWVFYDAPDRWLRFDAQQDEIAVGTLPQPSLTNWAAQQGGLRVTDWKSSSAPKLNGKVLALQQYEKAQSVAVAPSGVLLGTSWFLRMFDAQGQQLWETSVPSTSRRVNQSPDGRLAIAALGDGTIRWYRLRDGQELLALFVTPDAKRWVAFTPSGYYTAGAGGEDLIGWQVNNGPDRAADFFPVRHFRERFYRPEVVARVLETLDETEAVRQADTAQASASKAAAVSREILTPTELKQNVLQDRSPLVIILSPRDGTQLEGDTATLEIEVRSPTGQAITRVDVRLDGLPVQGMVSEAQAVTAAPGEKAERRRIKVPVPPGHDATLQVIARSNDRASDPAELRVRGRPAPAGQAVATELSKPRLSVVLVGVSAYQNTARTLKFAAKDAQDLADALRHQEGPDGLYSKVTIRVLPEGIATREAILREILWLQREVTQRDLAVLFLAGHGMSENGEYYFLPVNADEDSVSIFGLSGTDLRRSLGQIPSRTIVLLDTCYAGALAGNGIGLRSPPPDLDKLVNELATADAGVAVYAATTGRHLAQERDELRNGVFTRALLDVLSGRSPPGQANGGVLRLNMLAAFLAEDVKALTDGKQASTYNALAPLADLPLFLVRK